MYELLDPPGRVAVATDESPGGAGLRFDLRVHGVSGGQESELKIVWSANNIRAACDHPRVRRYVAGTDTCQFTERDANGELAPGVAVQRKRRMAKASSTSTLAGAVPLAEVIPILVLHLAGRAERELSPAGIYRFTSTQSFLSSNPLTCFLGSA
ncbi:hypothetical protein [Streptomyces niveus]|uniref:hypothetical protein n=1 Tax=Streptomyces niveus TaxID=193462 RepID=UPI00364C7343